MVKVYIHDIGRELELDDAFPTMSTADQGAYIDDVVDDFNNKKPTWTEQFRAPIAQGMKGIGETLDAVGAPGGDTMRSVGDAIASPFGAPNRAMDPNNPAAQVSWRDVANAPIENLGGYLARVGGGAVQPVTTALAGGAAGGAVGGPIGAIVGAIGAPAASQFVTTLGPTVKEIATRNGREEPSSEDWQQALLTSSAEAAINGVAGKMGIASGAAKNLLIGAVAGGATETTHQVGVAGKIEDPSRILDATIDTAVGFPVAKGMTDGAVALKNIPHKVRVAQAKQEYSRNSEQVASDLRTADLFEARRKTTDKFDRGEQVPADVEFKNISDDLKGRLAKLSEASYKAGDIDADGRKVLNDVISRAGRHNRSLGEDGDAAGYFSAEVDNVRSLKLPKNIEEAFVNTLRDLETTTFNAFKKNRKGPFESAADHTNPFVNAALGYTTLGPIGLGLGALATRGVLKKGARVADRFLGLDQPPILARARARREALQQKGVNYGNTVDTLRAALQDATSRGKLVVSQKATSPIDKTLRDEGVQRNGGWMRSIQEEANKALPPEKHIDQGAIVEAIKDLQSRGILNDKHVSALLGDRSGKITDERVYYGIQDWVLHRAGGLDQAGAPRAENSAEIKSGIRNPEAYSQTMRNVQEATSAAADAAPSPELRSVAMQVANARSKAEKLSAYQSAKQQFPEHARYLDQFVEPLTKFGPRGGLNEDASGTPSTQPTSGKTEPSTFRNGPTIRGNKVWVNGKWLPLDDPGVPTWIRPLSAEEKANNEAGMKKWLSDVAADPRTLKMSPDQVAVLKSRANMKLREDLREDPGKFQTKPVDEPIVRDDGLIELVHYSDTPGIGVTNPYLWGKANPHFLPRSERNRVGHSLSRTYFGMNVDHPGGYQKERGLGNIEYYAYVKPEELYDASSDPLGFRKSDGPAAKLMKERGLDGTDAFDRAVFESGYKGYWSKSALGMVAQVFEALEVSTRPLRDSVPNGGANHPMVNIGLDIKGGGRLTEELIQHELRNIGVRVKNSVVVKANHEKGNEDTVAAVLDRPLTPDEASKLSSKLHQDAIAQKNQDGSGSLYGPRASDWGEFNPDFFFLTNGKRLSETMTKSTTTGSKLYSNPMDPEAIKKYLVDPSAKVLKNFVTAVQEYPGLQKVLPLLTPDERSQIWKRNAKTFLDAFSNLPATEEVAATAYAARAKRGWYSKSSEAILRLFGERDAPRFAALLAATSPQTSVQSNAENALRIWTAWDRDGRPTDRASIVEIMGANVQGTKGTDSVFYAWINNTVRALSAEDPSKVQLSGPKVNSFMLNLSGILNEVTNDAWMATYAAADQRKFSSQIVKDGKPNFGVKSPAYLGLNAKVRDAADHLTKLTGEKWTPAEVQETVWSFAKTLYELRDSAGETRTMEQLLKDGAVTHEMIAETPDFALLFQEPKFREILEEGGYGQELESLIGAGGRSEQAGGTPRPTGGILDFDGEATPFDRSAAREGVLNAARRIESVRDRRLEDARSR